MRPGPVVGCAVLFSALFSFMSAPAQEISGMEHWVEHAGLRLHVWEKYVGSPAGKLVVVLAHGSGTAGRAAAWRQVLQCSNIARTKPHGQNAMPGTNDFSSDAFCAHRFTVSRP